MMPVRRACSVVLACAFAVAGLAGCSTVHVGPTPCCASSQAYALDVTTAGRVRWQVPLAGAVFGSVSGRLPPLAVGAVAVFAQGDVIHGLRLADGHQVWSRATRQDIAGMWRWRGLVIVLTDGAGGSPLLMGLDASTGQARWTEFIAAEVQGSYLTADGGLAILRSDDRLEVVELSSGRVRWTRPAGYPPDSGQAFRRLWLRPAARCCSS